MFNTMWRLAPYSLRVPTITLGIIFALILYNTVPLFGFFFMVFWVTLVSVRVFQLAQNRERAQREAISDQAEKERIDAIIDEMEQEF